MIDPSRFTFPRSLTRHILLITTLVILLALSATVAPRATLLAQEPVTLPADTPDAQNGLELFAARCAGCHGPLGQGDGEMAAQLPRPPTALGSEAYVSQAVPAAMFDVITHGIVEAGMPPFGPGNSDPLSEQGRWDLVAAIYSLGASQALMDEGQALYEERCQACHAADGSGAGQPLDLRNMAYWLERSNEQVQEALPRVPEHEALALADDELRAVTNYARTFSYDYADPLAALAPIEAAVITGTVTNESTGQPMQAGTPAVLNAFNADFQPSLTMTTTLDSEGQYAFDLTMTPPDLVYVVTVQYDGISYGSDFGRLQRDNPALTLDIPVFERSSDASTVAIEQLHVIVQFGDGVVQVSELYQFSQNASAVFVGESGDPASGTVRVAVPPSAGEPSFDRSFGGMESFFPADSVIPVDGEWADTVPLRPGSSSLSLLVRYTMPYDGGVTVSHPVHYPVGSVNLVIPDAGVEVSGAGWQEGEPQVMGEAGVFLTYSRASVPAGQELRFALLGTPRQTTAAPDATAPLRDQNEELLIGGGVLLLAVALGVYMLQRWRQKRDPDEHAPPPHEVLPQGEGVPPEEALARRRQELLQRIAALDDAFDAGELAEVDYQERRSQLKEELLAIWHD